MPLVPRRIRNEGLLGSTLLTMSNFRVFLIGSPEPLDLDLPAHDLADLMELASRSRFIVGSFEADNDGLLRGVMVPTNRIHLVVEA